MCGIIGAFDTTPKASVNDEIANQFEEQHSRGTEGFGVIGWNQTKKITTKRACEAAKFMFDLFAVSYPMMIAHHRNPTSSNNFLDQTHPLLVSNESLEFDYLVVHNGVISNPKDLRKKHEDLGFTYTTAHTEVSYSGTRTEKFNDSEAFAIEIARYIENHVTVCDVLGSVAFIAVQVGKKTGKATEVFFGRNTNPLNMAKSRQKLFLSSEGKGEAIKADTLYSFIPKGTMDLKQRALKFAKEKVAEYKPVFGYKAPPRNFDWIEDEYGGWKGYDEAPPGKLFQNAILDTTEDMITDRLEVELENMDNEDSIAYVNIDEFVKDVRELLEDAKSQLMEKYAYAYTLPDKGGDNADEAESDRPLPADAAPVETS